MPSSKGCPLNYAVNNMKLKISFAVNAAVLLTACGGGGGTLGDVSSQQNQDPAIENAAPSIVLDEIWLNRTANPNQGVRYRTFSDGSVDIWFDPELAISESTTYVQGTGIPNANSYLQLETGDNTGELVLFASSWERTGFSPGGNVTYNGESLMLIEMNDSSERDSSQVQKFGTANMTIDFSTGLGNLTASSIDGNSLLQISVSTDAAGWLVGDGTFQTNGDTYTGTFFNGALGCSVSPGGCGLQEVVIPYDPINESTDFLGSLVGSNGEAAMGISAGDNHAIGISLE